MSSATVLLAIVITIFAQQSVAVNDNSEQCGALVASIVRQIRDPTALTEHIEYILELQTLVNATLHNQYKSSRRQVGSVAAVNLPSLNTDDSKKAVEDIRDQGLDAILSLRDLKVDEFGHTFGDQIFAVAQATARHPRRTREERERLTQEISRFCTQSLGVVDGLNTKIVANIESFVKRSNGNPPQHDTCGFLVNEIIQKLTRTSEWDASTEDAVSKLYLRRIARTAAATQKAIESASAKIIKSLRDVQINVDMKLIQAIAVATIGSYQTLDINTFLYHFGPRFQRLVESENAFKWNQAVVALTGNDIANICRGALDDYQRIQKETIAQLETAIPNPESDNPESDNPESERPEDPVNEGGPPPFFNQLRTETIIDEKSGIPITIVILPNGEILMS